MIVTRIQCDECKKFSDNHRHVTPLTIAPDPDRGLVGFVQVLDSTDLTRTTREHQITLEEGKLSFCSPACFLAAVNRAVTVAWAAVRE